MLLADLHTHSNFSDGQLSLERLIDFYGVRGFKVLAVTDHLAEENTLIGKVAARYLNASLHKDNFKFYLQSVLREKERAWREYRMLVIPGVEVSKNKISNSRSAHIIGLGISDWIDADQDIPHICSQIHEQGGLTIAAHPVYTRRWEKQALHLWDRRQELSGYIDAWEVASGQIIFPEVLKSGLPLIANSDFHRPSQINAWKTLLHCEPTQSSVFAAIRSQNVSFQYYRESSFSVLPSRDALSLS